jgi:hypothetical protein
VYNKLDFSADEEAARKRFQERYTKLSDWINSLVSLWHVLL